MHERNTERRTGRRWRVVLPALVVAFGAGAAGQDVGDGEVDRAMWSARLAALTDGNWRTAFSTGDELREPGAPLAAGCIYDSNRTIIQALLTGLGCAVDDLGILADDFEVLRAALAAARPDHDLIVTSGGVSVGEEDHVRAAVEALGRLHLWRLAIKPGRPIALGQIGSVPFVGLPGNPVAVVVTFLTIVRPMILRLMGGTGLTPHHFRVPADFSHRKKKNRREWLRARLVSDGEAGWRAVKFARQGAGILTSLVEAEGLVELPEEMTVLEPGTLVDFLPFSEVGS